MTLEQPEFLVRGTDDRDYPADIASLTEWVRSGRVTPDQMVFVSSESRWVRVRDFPQFAERTAASLPRADTPRSNRPYFIAGGIGCLTVIAIAVVLAVIGWLAAVRDQKAAAEARQTVRRERERRDRALSASASATAEALRVQLDRIEAAERSRDVAAVDAALAEAKRLANPYVSLKPLPAVLSAPMGALQAAEARAILRSAVLRDYDAALAKQRQARSLKDAKD